MLKDIATQDLIEAKIKSLPTESGVYLMRDDSGTIIYVGKAKSLKSRVTQYFRSETNHSDKVRAMVSHISDFEYIITRSEVEALVLESNLIKQHKPHYNILLKDDKNYPYIRIDTREDYPVIEIVRKLPHDGATYFGPFMLGASIREITDIIEAGFLLRTCKRDMTKTYSRPCLNHDMGRCNAPCMKYISKEDYHKVVDQVIAFLKGDDKEVRERITSLMTKASENEDYETAIYYRDRLRALDKLVREQVCNIARDLSADVIAYTTDGEYAVIDLLTIRGGKTLGNHCTVLDEVIPAEEAIAQYVAQYYDDVRKLPHEIYVSHSTFGAIESIIEKSLGKKIPVRCPERGDGRKLTDIAGHNARYHLEKLILDRDKKAKTISVAQELATILGIPSCKRMECYDISNISGTDKVASMVVFIDGQKAVSHYRRFRIKTVEGADDFASMAETLSRRVKHIGEEDMSLGARPDLIVIDGGKGQLHYAHDAICQEGYSDLNMVSLAKRDELIYRVGVNEPIMLLKTSAPLKLMQQIRDEAHRFAITYHRSLRAERMTRSVLSEIEGIGDKKIKALYSAFSDFDSIRQASVSDLNAVKGISKTDAENIYNHFRCDK